MGRLRIFIVGGGIGGLSAALSLQRAGFDPIVFEQARGLGPVGGGIQISPNAARVLIHLGLGGGLSDLAVIPAAIESRSFRSGRPILSLPMGERSADVYGAPYYHVHRADLHALLVEAIRPGSLRLSARCTGFIQDSGGVRVDFEDGTSEHGDVLIGADGIHSAVRAAAFGPEAPRFSGAVAYRGLIPAERIEHLSIERKATVWWGPGRHFVHYFVSRGRSLNFVAIVPSQTSHVESWSTEGSRDELLAEFKGWHPTVQALTRSTDRVHKLALYDRDPLPRWSVGRVTLLGDAAHAMLPFQAQGAAQGIEDAIALARCLSRHTADPPAAFEEYERRRKPRTSRVQEEARRNGKLFHIASPTLVLIRDTLFRTLGRFRPEALAGMHSWLFGHDALAES
jgi:salicylate hydroxylase